MTKLQLVYQPSQPERIAAENLKPGQFLAADMLTTGRPTEVLFVDTYPSDGGGRETLLVHRPIGVDWSTSSTVGGSHWFDLATEEQLAQFRAGVERAQKIEDIRALATWLEDNPDVPMPYHVEAHEHWSEGAGDPETSAAMATIRNLGQMYGIELDEHASDRTRFVVPFGKASYELVVWHKGGRPAELGPRCVASLHIPTDGATCYACRAPGFMYDDGDPTGLAYSRADDDTEVDDFIQAANEDMIAALSQVVDTEAGLRRVKEAAARVPMHTGALTEQGLVDETPVEPPVHLEIAGAKTMCGLALIDLDTGVGWTNDHDAITCPACLEALPF